MSVKYNIPKNQRLCLLQRLLSVQAQAADMPRGNGAFWLIRYAHEPETAEKKP
jgi:hypothetical protein